MALLFAGVGCAILHHAQVGMIDNRAGSSAVPIEIMVSEAGVNLDEAADIARATGSRTGDDAAGLAKMIAFFQIGPRTGNPVYNERYAEKVLSLIHEQCPSGRVTGLMSVREMRKYPVISGEIIKITGFCLKTRATASEQDVEEELL